MASLHESQVILILGGVSQELLEFLQPRFGLDLVGLGQTGDEQLVLVGPVISGLFSHNIQKQYRRCHTNPIQM